MARMRSYLPMLGVTPETIPLIEASYLRLLDLLDAHFAEQPYLFGGQPSLGDYGLLGPLFAHLGRDPVPADLMRRRAPKVFPWVERMNAPDADAPEFSGCAPAYLPGDTAPPTLEPLFRHMAEELLPELPDKLRAFEAHLAAHDPAPGSPVTAKPHQRVIGSVRTRFRGVEHESGLQPYMLYLWRRVLDAFESADAEDRSRIRAYFERCGLTPVLDGPPPGRLRVERRGYAEVWGDRS